ncbi:DUF6906 family protein [Clostridium felsineum]|uniref:DUF6906 domain-containing protein n=1 Tax=Clostridium felsineum TaxID=36839 RepID=A0A1S8MDN8_9CLOT|nr:hypothetical protein [Clostridium felsineum]URZ06432.1 hypothetical protein CLROS_017650 [Clostridium felsineum]URZ11467.1 hypothetical protein CROST_021840 [Clostridium felsineum]
MKHGKRPTLKQRERISKLKYKGRNLNPENWLVVKDTSEEFVLVNKNSGHQEKYSK